MPAYENNLCGVPAAVLRPPPPVADPHREVDRYRATKVGEGRLAHETINKHLVLLGQILDIAAEYDLIARNPVKVGKRNVHMTRGHPVHLGSTEHIAALLARPTTSSGTRRAAARQSGAAPWWPLSSSPGCAPARRCDLLWRDVDVAAGRIAVGRR